MMFLPGMSMINDTSETESDPNMKTAIVELIQNSAKELVYNRGHYEEILLGEVKVVGNFISADKARILLLKTLREKNEFHILTRDESPTGSQKMADTENSSPPMARAVLNVQFYNSEGQIWQAQQLVDMRLNLLLWSGIHSIAIPSSVQRLENIDAFYGRAL